MLRHPTAGRPWWGGDGGNGSVVDNEGMTNQPPSCRVYMDIFAETPPRVTVTPDFLRIHFGDAANVYLTQEAAIGMIQALAAALEEEA